MKKTLLNTLLFLITTVAFSQSFTVDYIAYEVTSSNTVKITDYDTEGGPTATIPESVIGNNIEYEVTAIGDGAFYNKQLTTISIPNSITHIGIKSLANNQLKTITIPNSVTNIGDDAFAENDQLHTITSHSINPPVIGDGYSESYEYDAFLIFPIESGYDYVFANGWSGFKGKKPYNTTFTKDDIIYNITSNTVPYTVEVLDYNISGGNTVLIPETVNYNNIDYSVTSITKGVIYKKPITSVIIPKSVTNIDYYALYNDWLKSVTYLSTNPVKINNNNVYPIFNNISFIELIIPKDTESVYQNAGWTDFKSIFNTDTVRFTIDNLEYIVTSSTSPYTVEVLNYDIKGGSEVIIPENITYDNIDYSVTSIGNTTFAFKELTSVTIPNSVTNIGSKAFTDNKLVTLSIGNSVTAIGDEAFSNNQLTSVTIPNSVTIIGHGAFYINKLNSLSIGSNVTNIRNGAFAHNQLTSVTIPNSVINIGIQAFAYNQLNSLSIGSNVTNINESAFNSNQLTTLTIPNSVTNIGDGAFTNNQLTSLTIPNSVTNIGAYAFSNNQLTSVTIPNSITSINFSTFYNNQLSTIVIPNSITSIGNGAFFGNQLTSLTIPNSVNSIGKSAFQNNHLESVTSLGIDPPNINNLIVFYNIENIDLKIPSGSESIYNERGWIGFKSVTTSDNLSVNDLNILEDIDIKTIDGNVYIENKNLKTINIDILDINGRTLKQQRIKNSRKTINIQDLNNGIYLLKIEIDGKILVQKIVKQ